MIGLAVGYASAPLLLRHHDLGWHLAAGDLIRATRAIPATDPWSYSAAGTPWLNLSWLWDVLASAIYAISGWWGLIAALLLLGAAWCFILARHCLERGAGPALTLCGVAWVAVTVPAYEMPFEFAWSVAPQSVTIVMAPLFHWMLTRIARGEWGWRERSLPLWMLLWANMHGGFLIAFVLCAAYIADAALRRDHRALRRLFMIAGGCGAAVLCNPMGWEIVPATWRSLGGEAQRYIMEWQPFRFGAHGPASAYLLAALLAMGWRDRRIAPADKILFLALLVMGLSKMRHFALFMLVSLPVVLQSLTMFWEESVHPQIVRMMEKERAWRADLALPRVRGAAGALLCALALLLVSPPGRDWRFPQGITLAEDLFPVRETAYLLEHYPHRRIFNHWNFGGYLIFAARGVLPIWIDGRAETAYPLPVIRAFARQEEWDALSRDYGADIALMPRYMPMLIALFSQNPGWKQVYSGPAAIIFERR